MSDIFNKKRAELSPEDRKDFDAMQKKLIDADESQEGPKCFGSYASEDLKVCNRCWFRPDCKVNTKGLDKIEKQLGINKEKEVSLDKRDKLLAAREDAVKEAEGKLAAREKAVTEKEAALNEREKELDKREEELTKAAPGGNQ